MAMLETLAGELPPHPFTQVAREDVCEEGSAGGRWGDYAVGIGYIAYYVLMLPLGKRVVIEDSFYVEDIHALSGKTEEELEEEGEGDDYKYGVMNQVEVREERLVNRWVSPDEWEWEEDHTHVIDYHAFAMAHTSFESAQKEARRAALQDGRENFFIPVEVTIKP